MIVVRTQSMNSHKSTLKRLAWNLWFKNSGKKSIADQGRDDQSCPAFDKGRFLLIKALLE
jgi:hypothetical protein